MSRWLVTAIVALILFSAGLVAWFDPFAWKTEEEVRLAVSCPKGTLVWGKDEIIRSSIVHRGEDEDGEWVTIEIVPNGVDWQELSQLSRQSVGDKCQLFVGHMLINSFVIENVIWEGPMLITLRDIEYAERLVNELN